MVEFTREMSDELIRLYWRGVDLEMMAHRLGVSRGVLRRARNALGLGSRRVIHGFYKYNK